MSPTEPAPGAVKNKQSHLVAKWRKQAEEAKRDLGAETSYVTRARLATEARILKRCARQLEQMRKEP